ncbi:MAG: hypothetical protein WC516_07335 [Patescibacteria group bacterium]|jgi:hypothetical protein
MSFDLRIENNDLKINPDGSIQTVRDNQKLIQDIIKALLTTTGDNKFFSWYGSSLSLNLIGQVLDNDFVTSEAERSIQNTLSQLISLQNAQARTQYVSAGEMIAAIRNVTVLRSNIDPRQYDITVSVLTRKLNVVEETFSLTL